MTTDLDPLNPADEGATPQEAEDLRKRKREQEVSDLKWLMGHEEGRRIAWRFLEEAGVFRTSFSLSELEMAFREGNRNAGVKLLGEINEHCPQRYMQMVKERKDAGNRSNKPNAS